MSLLALAVSEAGKRETGESYLGFSLPPLRGDMCDFHWHFIGQNYSLGIRKIHIWWVLLSVIHPSIRLLIVMLSVFFFFFCLGETSEVQICGEIKHDLNLPRGIWRFFFIDIWFLWWVGSLTPDLHFSLCQLWLLRFVSPVFSTSHVPQ